MARLALTPVNFAGSAGLVLGSAGNQTVGANTGISFTNNGLLVIAFYVASGGACNLTQNFGRTIEGQAPAPVVKALAASTNYLLGPWSPADFTAADGTGLTYFDLSGTQTSNTVTLYQLTPAI